MAVPRGTGPFTGKTPSSAWTVSQAFNRCIDNPLPRRRIPRKPHLIPYWSMDADLDNSPIAVAPMLAQPAKGKFGLLGQARLAKSLQGTGRDPRTHRNPQRFTGTQDWAGGEGIHISVDRLLSGHISAQTATHATANTQITAQLVRCNPGAAGMALTLPDVTTWTVPVWIKNGTAYDSDIIIYGYTVAQRIDGARSVTINQPWDSLILVPDQNHWWTF